MKNTQLISQIIIALILLSGFVHYPKANLLDNNETNERIKWDSNIKLNWEDFKGKSNKNSHLTAETNSGIHFNYHCSGDKMICEIYAYFDVKKSWAKPNSTLKVLNHEQIHFDITELFARKMRQKFQSIRNPCKKSKEELQAIFSEIMKQHRNMQNDYDRETNHSIKEKEQARWIEKIELELIKMENFK